MLIERGVKPESLPPAEDVRKVERKLNADEKKLIKNLEVKCLFFVQEFSNTKDTKYTKFY
jgi:hypothetical protein